MIKRFLIPINDNGDKRAAMAWLPDDYDTNPEPCSLLEFNHGTGQSGDGTLGTVDKLLENGSPLAVAQARGNMTFTNPITKKSSRYIILGIQGINGWCAYSQEVAYAINYMIKNYRIDANVITVTGLSAGGETTWEAVGGSSASLYTFAVPMSTPAIDTKSVDWSKVSAKVWAFHGNQDGGLTQTINSQRYVDGVNAVKPGYAKLTLYNGGHGNWGTYFSDSYRETINGISCNIYELGLACPRGSTFLLTGSSTTIPTTTLAPKPPVQTVTKAVSNITISGNIITLDGTGSVGNGRIQSSGWRVTDTKGNYIPPKTLESGIMDAGPYTIPKAKITLANGLYNIELKVQDQYGYTDIVDKQVIIGAIAQITTTSTTTTTTTTKGPIEAIGVLDGITYILYPNETYKKK